MVVVTLPDTVTESLARVIRSVSPVTPIAEPSITTLSTVNLPPEITPVVVIVSSPTSIDPKSDVIEPEFNAPTVTILA